MTEETQKLVNNLREQADAWKAAAQKLFEENEQLKAELAKFKVGAE